MSRRRYLSTEISIDTAVNRLARTAGDFAVMLYTWMIPHCDDDGIVHGDAEEIILQVIPGRRDKKIEDVTAALAAMQEHGLIEWDEPGRRVVFPAASFYKYQTYIKPERRRGTSGADRNNAPEVAKDADNAANQRKTPQNTVSHSHPVKHSHSPSVRETPAAKPPRVPKPASPRNDLFDALLTACGFAEGAALTEQEGARIGKAAADIKRAGGTAEDVPLRAVRYQEKYTGAALTPLALAGHWGELAAPPAARAAQNGRASPADRQERTRGNLVEWFVESEGIGEQVDLRQANGAVGEPLRARTHQGPH